MLSDPIAASRHAFAAESLWGGFSPEALRSDRRDPARVRG
ncbi:hypothetical protein GLE_2902 [Lysobacter enzymogenes]|uniref:Uncharacterized protein n=1 Tax=Lysobacter enzymogenes TaxID=69 RepID=A0A0S2DI88_LYSEN|nr:hypothetical protein GLE_2902 [Lysobacter enzymogenes]